jgi:putative CocE/NonD family hydrolase
MAGSQGGRRLAGAALCALAALALPAAAPAATPASLAPKSFDPGAARHPGVNTTHDVPIVMRDGTRLYADVRVPARADGSPAPGRFPVILTQTPYNKNSAGASSQLAGADDLFPTHGYVHVIVDVRGTGSSEGTWDSFGPAEQADAMDIARWIAAQAFSDGDLVLYGASYMGINQILTAAQHPPGLKAIFPIIPAEDVYRDVTWHGGAIDAGFIPLWLGLVTALKIEPPQYAGSDPAEALKVMLSRVSPGLEFPTNALVQGTAGGELSYDGDFYRLRSPGTVASRVNVPTFVVGGWYDLFQRGEPRLYRQLPLPPGRKQLLMGPWYHVTTGNGLGAPGTPPALDVLALAWFNRWVKGQRNGIENFGPVTVQQTGSRTWETYRVYPRHDVRWRRFYLRPGEKSGSARSLNDAVLSPDPPRAAGADTAPANPVNGLCTRSTTQWTAGLVAPGATCEDDNRFVETTGLTYTTPPLSSPLHLSGPLGLRLRGATTAHDTTWIATVSDVSPNGQSNQITAGWLVQSFRALDRSRSTFAPNGDAVVPFHPFTRASLLPVTPGETDPLDVEIFNTDAVLAPGHRLRLTLTSGDVPHLMTPVPITANSVGAVNTVRSDPGAASYLTVAEAPLGPEPAPFGASCTPTGRIAYRLRKPRGARIVSVAAFAGKRLLLLRRGRSLRTVTLRNPPRGHYRLKLVTRDSRGHRRVARHRVSNC